MAVSRRLILQTIPLAAVLGGLAACGTSTGTSASTTTTASPDAGTLTPTDASLALDTAAWSYDAEGDVYYQMGLAYGSSIQDAAYETLSIFLPGAYVSAEDNGEGTYTLTPADGTAGAYTSATAPVVLPVNTPGYSAQSPLSEYSYSTIQAYMEAGLIYVVAGLRGKDSTSEAAAGNAPWGVADLKAAVRYLRYNAAALPGDSEQVYVFGHSGGGAQSAVMGASGDSALYTPYLAAIGAATTDTDGNALSDAVAGAMCWCPITSLNEANAAYEWNMGQFASDGTRAEGTWTEAYSKDLAAAYASWVNGAGLTDADGNALTLQESGDGVYLAGTYYEHLMGLIEGSLNDFLAVTTFPYTPSSTTMAGMEPGGSSGGAPSGQAPSGEAPSGAAPGGSSSSESTTYETVESYFQALNADGEWVVYDSAAGTASVTSLAGFVTSQKPASKDVSALDGVDRGQTENTVLGVGAETLHFSQVSRDVVAAGESSYAALTGWAEDYGSAGYDADLAQTDSLGTDVLAREQMYNPMFFLLAGSEGSGTSTVAPSWRIRTGIQQGDTATTVEMNLALALQAAGRDVDFATVWGQGHTMAELTGDGESAFIAWVQEASGA
ncbi:MULTISPECIES: subtype A tannase [unclassified Actinomyces]|uniref:subtype A tannase n=1 Tax=unclassified Actinomyces TaxID=2609248 RepID=UPI0024B61CD5|nr:MULTISPECIES: subtype A tannase [unclassified Actinomyces]MCL3776574.1 carboxylesterase family protein [Actinomyces sp. AC-20-1]MCL3788860.1 carboxylesterase family protein [Actinomyces sp. 187325]MCL3791034.1 carboxylesterase family protein [Actinomyces sp. 186855]MCL3793440.1 carboxylesterase family protein [Actinomyces sp. 217892]